MAEDGKDEVGLIERLNSIPGEVYMTFGKLPLLGGGVLFLFASTPWVYVLAGMSVFVAFAMLAFGGYKHIREARSGLDETD